ncbi:MAG: prepilin-type N-terminal cleavage/methylation domain-containing protein [Gammaproteobacteria bacterium]|nr:prepilin-type N-terminal cleavage/methylation domain-containing protein [Gammaproteobacteria bacterium]
MEGPRGFTLPEFVFTIAIVAGLAGWTIPTFRDIQRNALRTRQVNEFAEAVHLARGEAIKRNGVVSLCPSSGTDACAPSGTPWERGWIVFVNLDHDAPADRDPGEELLHSHAGWKAGRIVANRSTLSFRAFGQSGVTATFAFCDDRGSAAARAVIISQTGRPRVSDRSASGSALTCN